VRIPHAETDPDAQERRLLRVLKLAELPEARALRGWLRTADQLDDAEIRGPSTFLIDHVVDQPGPYSFLSDTWPSLFHGT
jgi:hypothetical protein